MIKKIIYVAGVIALLLIGYFAFNQKGQQTMKKDESAAAKLPFAMIDKSKKYQAVVETTAGKMTIDLYADKTPITVSNFVSLAKKGFYKDTIFHRVISGFMIQGGDPKGDGTGNPGYRFDDEAITLDYKRGIIAMANSGPNTNGSQFFIMHADYPLPKNYVIFGQVVEGIDTVDRIATAPVKVNPYTGENSTPVTPEKINSVVIEEK